ncbi:hypothetical protein [Halomicrobium katesii]|uniref:hypothetical protein n=1 Tax=Halomicrobium katesii TaxID=437163 RepID=UPI001FDF68AC|nr:hypothetical protein [Halomicrobium katesii]
MSLVQGVSRRLDARYEAVRTERLGLDVIFRGFDGRFHARTTIEISPVRLGHCRERVVEPATERRTFVEDIVERLPVVFELLERLPDAVVLHVERPCPLEQPVRVGRIAEFAPDRLEDEERKWGLLRRVAIEEVEEDWFKPVDVGLGDGSLEFVEPRPLLG